MFGCEHVISFFGTPPSNNASQNHFGNDEQMALKPWQTHLNPPSKKNGTTEGGDGSPEVFNPSKQLHTNFISMDGTMTPMKTLIHMGYLQKGSMLPEMPHNGDADNC